MDINKFEVPRKFSGWREYQEQSVIDFSKSKKRFVVMMQPTGSGKSLCYYCMAKLLGGRTCILTSTKLLQDQLHDDFGIPTIKGQNAYICHTTGDTCNYGPCKFGHKCEHSFRCEYQRAYNEVLAAPIFTTNYSYWVSANRFGRGIGHVDFLILDEAHDAGENVCGALGVNIPRNMLKTDPHGESVRDWAFLEMGRLMDELSDMRTIMDTHLEDGFVIEPDIVRRVADLDVVCRGLKIIKDSCEDLWAIDITKYNILCQLASPIEFTEKFLFRGIDKVLLTSATINTSDIDALGIEDYDYFEYPHTFPVKDRMFYYYPVERVDYKMTDGGKERLLGTIDMLLDAKVYQKGIIHSVSYKNGAYILTHSRHRNRMITHTRHNTASIVHAFKMAEPGTILVSPSVVTGYDFPGKECEWQIMLKIPFPDMRSNVMKMRKEIDPLYVYNIAAKTITQACGRGTRYLGDHCDTFIFDKHFSWFFGKYFKLFPFYFRVMNILNLNSVLKNGMNIA